MIFCDLCFIFWDLYLRTSRPPFVFRLPGALPSRGPRAPGERHVLVLCGCRRPHGRTRRAVSCQGGAVNDALRGEGAAQDACWGRREMGVAGGVSERGGD
jgi:hypothetical protein